MQLMFTIVCRKLEYTSQEMSDIMEQRSELEASLSQCRRENDQLTGSVSVTINNSSIIIISLHPCS